MHRRENSGVRVQVRMFGEFSIAVNGKALTGFKGRTKRVWLLVQYLLAHRRGAVPLDRLVEDLWGGSACGDPKNALKNLVYRARSLLQNLAGDVRYQFIVFENGTYRWNNACRCEVDAEQFELFCSKCLDESLPVEDQIAAFGKAASLYAGEYLKKSAWCAWASEKAERYKGRYLACAEHACALLLRGNRFDEAAAVCRRALKHLPYEVSLHCLLLQAYVGAGRRSKAFDHYNRAKELFYRAFCVDVSDTLLPYYRQLTENGARTAADLDAVKRDLAENPSARGAFFCDYDIFRSIYRTQARMVSRTGACVFLALFTLSGEDGAPPKNSETARIASEKLKSAMISSLRRSDVATSYSAFQFIALLPAATYEDAQSAAERVKKKFRYNCRRADIRLNVSFSPLD